ncbi:hypothetical protein [Caballeronia sp. KNU42]
MSRPAAVSADQIRTTVLAMLAEAGMDNDHQPPSGERFRHVVSVRKLRARLGAGDPATLARILNTIETEVVRAGLAGVAIPGLRNTIAEQSLRLVTLVIPVTNQRTDVPVVTVVRFLDSAWRASRARRAGRRRPPWRCATESRLRQRRRSRT